MLKQEDSGGNNWGRACDACRSAASTVYCRADSAFLCAACDSRIHAANKVASRHHRVCVCEACERAPAAFLCKADAASLCHACDADIHSANPLSHRHHRVPILPIPGASYGPHPIDPGGPVVGTHAAPAEDDGFLTQDVDETIDENDEDEAASWLLLTPHVKSGGASAAPRATITTTATGCYLAAEKWWMNIWISWSTVPAKRIMITPAIIIISTTISSSNNTTMPRTAIPPEEGEEVIAWSQFVLEETWSEKISFASTNSTTTTTTIAFSLVWNMKRQIMGMLILLR